MAAPKGAALAVGVVVVLGIASAAWYWFQKKAGSSESSEEEIELKESTPTYDPEEEAKGWIGRQVDKVQDWVAGWGDDE